MLMLLMKLHYDQLMTMLGVVEKQPLLLLLLMLLTLRAWVKRPRAEQTAVRECFGAALGLVVAAIAAVEKRTFVPACCAHFLPLTCVHLLRLLPRQ